VTLTSRRLGRSTVALSGAWLPIVFSSSVLLPQHVATIVTTPTWSATYAAVSATGWLTVIVGLTLSGYLQDRHRFGALGGSGARWTVPLLAGAVLLAGAALSYTSTVPSLVLLWVATVLPGALGITLLAARAADSGASSIAAASAIGSAPLLAVFLGSLTVTAAPLAGAARFPLIAAIAAGLMLLGAQRHSPTAPGVSTPTPVGDAMTPTVDHDRAARTLPPPLPPVTDPVVRGSIRRHRRLLGTVALVDTATVTLTFSIVPLVFLLPRSDVAAPGAYAERLVLAATVCSLSAVWIAPRLAGLRTRPRALFVLAGLGTGGALAVAPFAGATALLGVALVAGTAVGASNAATFALFLSDPASGERRATGLGLLNAMPSLPAALVPLTATGLLRWSPSSGLVVLMLGAATLAMLGAVIIVGGRGSARRDG
jgi:hypothetical protein